ncbi:type II toxin-antitoxin system RelE/ParE family toxin [Labrys miyagiensis]|uniref:type II toxin-antitoxin system RelE/ParE family toxin n=1 Tax=Labrys miyagiensis TaxID=346912 RepID=UPI0024E138C8|nr:type II toxin-antitoxin system RelE/ParE family toxin [Labrys miyagiensis]
MRYSKLAKEDLLKIWRDIAVHDEAAADRIFDLIHDRCDLLRDQPRLGPQRPEIGEGTRVLVIEKWIAFYREIAGGVQIVRVVDGRRDLKQIEWLH